MFLVLSRLIPRARIHGSDLDSSISILLLSIYLYDSAVCRELEVTLSSFERGVSDEDSNESRVELQPSCFIKKGSLWCSS